MDTSLNFCMITTFYPPYHFGGDAIFIYRLSNELAKRGHNVDVIHCKDSYLMFQPKGPKGNFPNHPKVTVHGLKSKLGILSPLVTQQTGYPLLKMKKIENILKSKRFDVIHYHNISLVGGPKLLRPKNEITLYTMHEHWIVCPMHVLWKYNKEVCTHRNCFRCSLVWKRPPQLWRYTSMLKNAIKNVDHFISPSRFTLKKHQEMGFHQPIAHMPYFLPLSEEQSFEVENGNRTEKSIKPYFLFVGRLEKIKGVQNLLPVFKNYSHAELLIAGDGEYGDALCKMAKGNDNVRFLGRMSHHELRKLYKNAIAVIVPSICYEVFGIIIESFSMKTPVIVNNLGAPPDVVEESGGGIIYNNTNELINALDTLRTNAAIRKRLSENGYAAYRKYWTEENCLKIYFDLISKIAEQKKH